MWSAVRFGVSGPRFWAKVIYKVYTISFDSLLVSSTMETTQTNIIIIIIVLHLYILQRHTHGLWPI